jgi:hypothetical protein
MITRAPPGNLRVTPVARAEKLIGPIIGSYRLPSRKVAATITTGR